MVIVSSCNSWSRLSVMGSTLVLLVFLLWIDRGNNAQILNDIEPIPEEPFDFFKKLNDPCTMEANCRTIRNGTCDNSSRTCECKKTHPVFEKDGNVCYGPAKLNQSCEAHIQCEFLDKNSLCSKAPNRVCKCSGQYRQVLGQTGIYYCYTEPPTVKYETDYTTMGILAGMVIMFIIMCVVLQMFSKARFQNQRTIFNDPQMLKNSLARKHRERNESERRGSRTSSKVPSRQPSVYSGINLAVKSPTHSQGSVKSGNDSRRSSVGSPRHADDVIVSIKDGHNTSNSSAKTHRI